MQAERVAALKAKYQANDTSAAAQQQRFQGVNLYVKNLDDAVS